MIAEIKTLIPKLDPIKDIFLIELLKSKMQLCIKTHNFTFEDREYQRAKIDLIKLVFDELKENDSKLQKAEKIIPECDKCQYSLTKYSAEYKVVYKSQNEDSEVCKSCNLRCHLLHDFMDAKKEEHLKVAQTSITDEIIKTKVMLTKVKNKISNLKKI